MLLKALVACAGVTLRETRVGFAAIRLTTEIDSDPDEDAIATLARLTERYCVVYQTLAAGATLSTQIDRA